MWLNIYNVRQYYFIEGEFQKYGKNYTLLKDSLNYKALNSNLAQQILKEVYGSFNADINGILNIIRKSNAMSLEALYIRGGVDTPVRIRIAWAVMWET